MNARRPGASDRSRPRPGSPPVVIPAHGRGLRMRQLTSGTPKTLLEVAGEPMLARLLRAAAVCGRLAVVYTRALDEAVPAFLANGLAVVSAGGEAGRCAAAEAGRWTAAAGAGPAGPPGTMAELRRREPHGYLTDMLAIAAELGDELTVLDSDMVVPHAELCSFLAGTLADNGAAFLVGQAAEPPSSDPRSIRVTMDPHGVRRLAPGNANRLPRTVGAYHWRPRAVRAAREFVADGPRSFHEFMAHLMDLALPTETFTFSAGLNVNTPSDRDLAEEHVRAWTRANPAEYPAPSQAEVQDRASPAGYRTRNQAETGHSRAAET